MLVDQGSSTDVLFWDAFVAMGGSLDELESHEGVLAWFSSDSVQVWGYIEAHITFGDDSKAKTITIRYMVVNTHSSYNILLGRPTIKNLRAVVSPVHMKMKYPTDRGEVGVIRVDQRVARKCYEGSLKNKKKCWQVERRGGEVELDPRIDYEGERPQPVEEVKNVAMGGDRFLKIGSCMEMEREKELVEYLKENLSSFAWMVQDMPVIDPDVMRHWLSMNPNVKLVVQKRRKLGEERRQIVDEEVEKLRSVGYVWKIQYLAWLANVVLVQKSNGKWRMCTYFTDLNKACPKDAYPLPNIDVLVDGVSGCELLSFMDAYSGYTVMPFGLKNA